MNKFHHAIRHSFASVSGWLRIRSHEPEFARNLLRIRWHYFKSRHFKPGFVTPDGFVLDTPDMLIAYWSMFVERELYSEDWVKVLQDKPSPLIVDVGANAGMFSHLVFSLNRKARIIAFEPLPMMVNKLDTLKQRNGVNLHCISKAAGRKPGEATLQSTHGYDGTSRISSSSQSVGQSLKVEITTLDNELPKEPILLMKIDVEGFEEEVLAGATESLSRTQFVIIEAHNAKNRDHLTHLLGHGWKRQKLGSSDYLFSRA
jgi:FkbM family methyltransferase